MRRPEMGEPGKPTLEREVSLPMLVLYGLGTTIGAGIYALTGEVAGAAGMKAPLAFAVSALLAGITAVGFAELAGRLPKAAGEAVFVDRAFGRAGVTRIVGLAVVVAGVVAASAISRAFGGYVAELIDWPRWLLVVGLVVALGAIAIIGVKQSVSAAAVLTVVEVIGLGLVVWAGRDSLSGLVSEAGELLGPPTSAAGWSGVMGGAFLAFFAFLGFEDMDAVAEETKNAPVNLPRAILITLVVTTVLYMTVAAVAVLEVDPALLAESDAPLALIYEEAGGRAGVLAFIAALAMVNGALVQLVMLPRVVYGLSNLGLVPAWPGAVSARTNTPVRATVGAVVVVAVLAISVELEWLARVTSATTMAIFITVNVALVAIKAKDGPTTTFQVPGWVPVVGTVAASGMFITEVARLIF
ncbi:MAG: amino acid permease [Actinomycetia bacterium]|nr:amino acid permease [Actinomycetes bacterium]MCP4226913.1 amino acid permease [Actinomycetes bacterium]